MRSIFLAIIFLSFFYCTHKKEVVVKNDLLKDGKYDSHFPLKPTSENLNEISETVKLVSSLSFYKKYFFEKQSFTTRSDIKNDKYQHKAISSVILEKPASGTATIIYSDLEKIALLTCAHTVHSPDTIITYFNDDDNKPTVFVESFGVKLRESLTIVGLPGTTGLELLAKDTDADIALLGKKIKLNQDGLPPVFKYPWGAARELDWGTFVYLVGFPHGKKMVSSSIVSNPFKEKKQNFIINATTHQGVSGGIVLALRDGPPNFELVGIANALSAKHSLVLKPGPFFDVENINPAQPYEGDVYLGRDIEIINGITFVIPVESIKEFIDQNREQLAEKGYIFDSY